MLPATRRSRLQVAARQHAPLLSCMSLSLAKDAPMPLVHANGIRIAYETRGDPGGEPLLLIMGVSGQLVHWPEDFCRVLVERGFHLILMDNRDAGLSERFEGLSPTTPAELPAFQTGELQAPYTYDDMAGDAGALLEALGVSQAHVLGASMGSHIARKLAIRRPEKVRSLALMMSTTHAPGLPPPSAEAAAAVAATATTPDEREAYADQLTELWRALTGAPDLFDAVTVRAREARAFDRAAYPEGVLRQMAAGADHRRRGKAAEECANLRVPTVVLHGREDPLLPVEHAIDMAKTVPDSMLVVIDRWGHEPPPPHTVAAVADALVANAHRGASHSELHTAEHEHHRLAEQ
jgi:pimeloyl-ACP methyl ester carboxylesterase